jgi:hypothetical protein
LGGKKLTRENALKEMLVDVDDPRKPSNGTRHDFVEMLVMTILFVETECVQEIKGIKVT